MHATSSHLGKCVDAENDLHPTISLWEMIGPDVDLRDDSACYIWTGGCFWGPAGFWLTCNIRAATENSCGGRRWLLVAGYRLSVLILIDL